MAITSMHHFSLRTIMILVTVSGQTAPRVSKIARLRLIREQLGVEPHAVAIRFDRDVLIGAVDAAGVVGVDDIRQKAVDVIRDLLVLARVGRTQNERRRDQRAGEDLTDCPFDRS